MMQQEGVSHNSALNSGNFSNNYADSSQTKQQNQNLISSGASFQKNISLSGTQNTNTVSIVKEQYTANNDSSKKDAIEAANNAAANDDDEYGDEYYEEEEEEEEDDQQKKIINNTNSLTGDGAQ